MRSPTISPVHNLQQVPESSQTINAFQSYASAKLERLRCRPPLNNQDKYTTNYQTTGTSIPNTIYVRQSVPYIPAHTPPQSYRYAFIENKLVGNVQQPTSQPPPNILLATFNMNCQNIREWALGASSHFLCLDASVTNKQIADDPITVIQPDGDRML
jgi:hypothetical protein